jgi:tetratricopeptide (TPR) repeat protein
MPDHEREILHGAMDERVASLERELLVLSDLRTDHAIRSYESKIDYIFQCFLSKCRSENLSLPSDPPPYLHRAIAQRLSEYLWTSKPKRFGKHFLLADVVDAQLDSNVDYSVGTCIGLTALYSVLGLRAGLNLSLLVNSDHLLSRLRVGPQSIDVDHTDPLGFECRSSKDFREFPLWTLTANVLNSRGLSHERSGRFSAARADYQKAIVVNPAYPSAFNNRGNMKFREEDLDGAIGDYTEAIRLNPAFCEAHCNRGLARQKLGRYEEARQDYHRALSLDSGYGDARRCLDLLDRLECRETSAVREESEGLP